MALRAEELESMDTTDPEELKQAIKEKVQEIEEETVLKEIEEETLEGETLQYELSEEDEGKKMKPWKIPNVVVNPLMRFYCCNRDWGCLFIGYHEQVLEHQKTCNYDIDDCPLNVILNCGWRGHEFEFKAHCYETHPGLIFAYNGKCSLWPQFATINKENKHLYLLILAYGELFYCRSYVNTKQGLVRWAVYYVGDPVNASQYCYEVDFEGEPIRKKGCYSIKRRCQPVSGGDVSFKEDGCSIFFHKMLKSLCAVQDLVYFVRIQKGEC